jgi:hypothetical protein
VSQPTSFTFLGVTVSVADAMEIATYIKTLPQSPQGTADFLWNIQSQECTDYPKSYVSYLFANNLGLLTG